MAEANLTILRDAGARAREADSPRSPVVHFGPDKPLQLDAGVELTPFQIAYQTYGTLDANRATRTRVKNFGFLFSGYTYPEADDKRNNQQHCRQIISIHPKLITLLLQLPSLTSDAF